MRILVDIADDDLKKLNEISRAEKTSRAQLVRCAVSDYVEARRAQEPDPLEEFFGMWADRGLDGLEYERKIRSEWDHRF